jgi:Leucine-rich repeat (LRR) protein
MTGPASGREIKCVYDTNYPPLWPEHRCCNTRHVDLSAEFEAEKHTFSGTPSQKSSAKTFWIHRSPKVDFIPLDIVTEFPKLNGLVINECNLPILKSGLLKSELNRIEFLDLGWNQMEKIEPEAFQYLVKLKWVRLYENKLKVLPNQVFGNSPDLIYIDLERNQINAIHPNFFDGLEKLKLIDFADGNQCSRRNVGCDDCSASQSNIKWTLETCFNRCAKDAICQSTSA